MASMFDLSASTVAKARGDIQDPFRKPNIGDFADRSIRKGVGKWKKPFFVRMSQANLSFQNCITLHVYKECGNYFPR